MYTAESFLKKNLFAMMLVVALVAVSNPGVLIAANAAEIDRDATAAMQTLYQQNPEVKKLEQASVAVLIFPKIVKAGLVIGGAGGDGVLRKAGKSVAYYHSGEASVGLQAGAQTYGYVLFFTDGAALTALDSDKGWEIGTGPSVVVLDEGFGKSLTTTTMKKGVYAYIFGQKGLMAGIGLKGSKITKFNPK
jgi:lipid-binding SYLF domain-containing protein